MAIGQGVAMAHHPRINERQHQQQQRIRHGIRNEELTRREAGRLVTEQARIRAYERRARCDGDLSFRERFRLDNMLDRSSRNIYRQTHDRQDRD
jgi:hypothetical protein